MQGESGSHQRFKQTPGTFFFTACVRTDLMGHAGHFLWSHCQPLPIALPLLASAASRPVPHERVPCGMALRWKLLVGLGMVLIALGLGVDWSPKTDPSLPDTRSFLLFLGGVVGVAGLLFGLKQEK